jgi:regulatory protein YycI of two-component signal transduction system YycFG
MKGKAFFLVCVFILAVFLSGILVGATIATQHQKFIHQQEVKAMTDQNLLVLERCENLRFALDNALGLRKPKAVPTARPGTED